MLDALLELTHLLGRETRGHKLPAANQEGIRNLLEALQSLRDDTPLERQIAQLAEVGTDDPERTVPALIALHLTMEEINSVYADLHDEIKRLIAAYPQIKG